MRRAALLLFILVCAVPAFAQTSFQPVTVQFPEIVFGANGDLNYLTIIQAVNNNSTSSQGHIALYSDTGVTLSASFNGGAPAPTFDFPMDSGVTLQIVISSTGPIAAGWMSITYNNSAATTTALLQYRAGTSVLTEVGLTPFYQPMSSTDFAVETGPNLNAGIAIVSPNVAGSVLVRLWDPNNPGSLLGSTIVSLPANGHIAKLLSELFPSVASVGQILAQVSLDSCGTSTCTTAGPGLIATALRLNMNTSSFTAIPVIQSPTGGSLVRVLPQIAVGGNPNGLNFQTALFLTTTASGGVTGVADIFDDNGNPINVSANGGSPSSHFAFTVLTNGVMKIMLSGNSTVQAGWVRLTLPQSEPLIVNEVYETMNGSDIVTEAGVLESPQITGGLFYADQTGVENVGIAFANPQVTSNPVTLTLYNEGGWVVDTQTVTLPPLGHLARYVYEYFPSTLSSASRFSNWSVSMQSPLGFSVIAMRVTGVNFATTPVAQTIMYVPSITNLAVTGTNRTTGTVSFTINVTDFTPNIVTPTSTAVLIGAGVNYPQSFDGYYGIMVDGSSLQHSQSGTLTGTFQGSVFPIPSGTQAQFYVIVTDSLGNYSNTAYVPIRF
jgi:hypothetical protein